MVNSVGKGKKSWSKGTGPCNPLSGDLLSRSPRVMKMIRALPATAAAEAVALKVQVLKWKQCLHRGRCISLESTKPWMRGQRTWRKCFQTLGMENITMTLPPSPLYLPVLKTWQLEKHWIKCPWPRNPQNPRKGGPLFTLFVVSDSTCLEICSRGCILPLIGSFCVSVCECF